MPSRTASCAHGRGHVERRARRARRPVPALASQWRPWWVRLVARRRWRPQPSFVLEAFTCRSASTRTRRRQAPPTAQVLTGPDRADDTPTFSRRGSGSRARRVVARHGGGRTREPHDGDGPGTRASSISPKGSAMTPSAAIEMHGGHQDVEALGVVTQRAAMFTADPM